MGSLFWPERGCPRDNQLLMVYVQNIQTDGVRNIHAEIYEILTMENSQHL